MAQDRVLIGLALALQAVCAGFFISDILSSRIGIRTQPIPWQLREFIEIGAATGLLIGFCLGLVAMTRVRRNHRLAEDKLREATTAFLDLVSQRFDAWALTPAERDVALFSIKGMTTAEIAALRGTSEGTVKAQSNAIYRKAGVSGRAQLLSDLIEALLDDQTMQAVAPDVVPPVVQDKGIIAHRP
ncbi:helix-turn-helix transcriptional regulator [Maritimibacter sp. UBA3975]|uniref:helix-turn-helix transcriptional regulator n=1 Tax=Maritimibacter sp. UBA3975 TaxID=1946833 RepID=UPI000C0A2D2B|nr:helix-turn-helix transcriptional regulator [Maritimibacter sp. UBA3975]MAM60378.1 helix-turn-helix transcriptional regulator [Maritimibacter sp.]